MNYCVLKKNTNNMDDLNLYTQISSLPTELKKEVSHFVQLLKKSHKSKPKIKARKPGLAKGLIKISPDFDEPLEDFKEYM